ncbi:MAG: hypothetical protein IJE43_21840, partial [Alphaproteobacteria bacterium]|nr:hypothetical protein [Alphaproteobacteria bacterium]
MVKSLKIALLISISLLTVSFSVLATDDTKTENYKLDEQKISDYETSKAEIIGQETQKNNNNTIVDNNHTIVTEEVSGGRIEKLVDKDGKIIAQKKIENDKVVEKILN